MRYSIHEVKKKAEIAIGMLFKNDSFLLENDVNERSISHKLAEYLQQQFPDYNVDCEYDKHGKYTKELEGIRECDEERKTDRILPDIIIHKRGTDDFNLVVLELKSKEGATSCDEKKLKLMTKKDGKFKYDCGLLILFRNNLIEQYVNGEKIRSFKIEK